MGYGDLWDWVMGIGSTKDKGDRQGNRKGLPYPCIPIEIGDKEDRGLEGRQTDREYRDRGLGETGEADGYGRQWDMGDMRIVKTWDKGNRGQERQGIGGDREIERKLGDRVRQGDREIER